jgi:hypothetical protein
MCELANTKATNKGDSEILTEARFKPRQSSLSLSSTQHNSYPDQDSQSDGKALVNTLAPSQMHISTNRMHPQGDEYLQGTQCTPTYPYAPHQGDIVPQGADNFPLPPHLQPNHHHRITPSQDYFLERCARHNTPVIANQSYHKAMPARTRSYTLPPKRNEPIYTSPFQFTRGDPKPNRLPISPSLSPTDASNIPNISGSKRYKQSPITYSVPFVPSNALNASPDSGDSTDAQKNYPSMSCRACEASKAAQYYSFRMNPPVPISKQRKSTHHIQSSSMNTLEQKYTGQIPLTRDCATKYMNTGQPKHSISHQYPIPNLLSPGAVGGKVALMVYWPQNQEYSLVQATPVIVRGVDPATGVAALRRTLSS